MTRHEGEWPYHEDSHGRMVPCRSNPCSLHSGGDIMATSPEDAYRKANGTMTSGMGDEDAERERIAAIQRQDMLHVIRTDMHAKGMEAGPRTVAGILEHAIFDRTDDCDDAMAIVRRFRHDMKLTPSYRLHPGTGQENRFLADAVRECAKDGEGGGLAKDLSVIMDTGMTHMDPGRALDLVRSYDNRRLRTMRALNINTMVDDDVAKAMIDNADRMPADVPGDKWEGMMGETLGQDRTGAGLGRVLSDACAQSLSMAAHPRYHQGYDVGDMCVQFGTLMDIVGEVGESDHVIKDGDSFRDVMIGSRERPTGYTAQTMMSV